MKKLFIFGTLCLGLWAQVFGQDASGQQDKEISGSIINSADNEPVIGAAVVVKGTMVGTVTDIDGKFKLRVPAGSNTLVVSFIGMKSQELQVGDKTSFDIKMDEDVMNLDEVVVTALGISREKKSLGYASQQVTGDAVTDTKSGNFVNQLSGKVAGVQVKTNNNFGGSTNVIIRGSSSITGNNQALFIVDGMPVNNSNTNQDKYGPGLRTQAEGQGGYDYGNAVADINPNDIESINVLKGAAATALYGSRAANGVVIITTKKGKKVAGGRQRYGVDFNSNVTLGFVDKKTFPTYQDQYGEGYGPYYDDPTGYFYLADIDGDGNDDLVSTFTEDASYGPAFDPNLMVYQWNSFDPESPKYKQATPWVNAENGPITFFETAVTTSNNIAVSNANDKGSFRVSYQKFTQKGIMPNARLERDNFGFNGTSNLTDKLSVGAVGNYVKTKGKGRNITGYNANMLSSFRQWWALNVDVQELKDMYDLTGRNVTWNPSSPDDPIPLYWNNFYFERYENYETDVRDRFYGTLNINYQLSEALRLSARFSADTYSELQEERMAVGSLPLNFGIDRSVQSSGYSRFDHTFLESNMDIFFTYNKDLSENLNLNATLGTNYRRTRNNSVFSATNGGLAVPGTYSLLNTKSTALAPLETASIIGTDGYFGSASLGFKRFLFLDVTARQDYFSTLKSGSNSIFYPSVAGSFIFSEKLKKDWLEFGKVRVNYAEVGNDAPFASLYDTYDKPAPFGSTTLFSRTNVKKTEDLRPERSKSLETGLEMIFLKSRLGFDVAYYNTNTIDQIFAVAVSNATGYSSKFVNAGKVQNSGIELNINGTPYKNDKVKWDVTLNWARNRNKVIDLFKDEFGNEVTNLVLASWQGGISLNATKGEPIGTLQGKDFVDVNGDPVSISGLDPVVKSNGKYASTSAANVVLGDVNPDWNAGITNAVTYKNFRFSALIDWQKGGDVFSLDQYYGLATGLYDNTVGNNELGVPVRESASNNGGLIFDGVDANGNPNTTRADGKNFSLFGYAAYPDKEFVYDAGYVKLRELSVTYTIPSAKLKDKFFSGASFSVVGNNLWIIHKNLPYADPESGVTSGNIQGWQSGVMPTTRNFGFNVNLQF
ncbi:MAG: SusC/RagA family TonB-linked outer membrane protein [Flavobacteriales bacterium]|nr:SusC/RagA family TonB-linked outer membrane protein [Flavobacteriales bacterium]MCB9449760.1 SusC/RagA family TonB-linked outer membrane protein [Flavobacteriales bacterium]